MTKRRRRKRRLGLGAITCDPRSVAGMRAVLSREMLRRRHALDRQAVARTAAERREAAAVVRGTRATIEHLYQAVEACVRRRP